MVVATNQGSYPYTSASDQFIAMTRMRSAESGVDLIHAGVVGRSTIFTDSGRMGPVTGQGTSEILRGVVQLRTTGPTLYARFGDWLQLLAIAAAVGVVVRAGLRGRDRVRPTE
jgi:apolipoprotein N-acyltransferase